MCCVRRAVLLTRCLSGTVPVEVCPYSAEDRTVAGGEVARIAVADSVGRFAQNVKLRFDAFEHVHHATLEVYTSENAVWDSTAPLSHDDRLPKAARFFVTAPPSVGEWDGANWLRVSGCSTRRVLTQMCAVCAPSADEAKLAASTGKASDSCVCLPLVVGLHLCP